MILGIGLKTINVKLIPFSICFQIGFITAKVSVKYLFHLCGKLLIRIVKV